MKKKIELCLSSLLFTLMLMMFFYPKEVNAEESKSYSLVVSRAGITNINKSLSLNKNSLTLWKGQSDTLTATKKNIGGALKWTTSNSKVAIVSSKGKITAKGVGSATIKVTAGGISDICKVTVKKPTIKLNKSTLSLTLGKSEETRLTASVNGASQTVIWKSSNTKIASVSGNGVINPKTNGKVTISATANGVTAKCVVTVKSAASTVNFKSLRGKNFSYKNSRFSFGIGFAKSTDCVYIGVWNSSGLSSSYEDFTFKIKEGTYSYKQKGMRSHYVYDITIKPYKDYIKISLRCQNSSYSHFNISSKSFKKTTNTTCSDYAEDWSVVEITDYLHGAGAESTIRYTQYLVDAIGGMKKERNVKYPDLYYTGNNMVIGVNNNPVYNTSKDEYIRIENRGNFAVLFYGVKIGDTRTEMEKKFSQYNIRTWDNGKTYSNANGWEVHVMFENGKLKRYIYLCRPTS